MKLKLPNVTLFCLDCIDTERVVPILNRMQEIIDFGAVSFLTSIETDYPHTAIESINGPTMVHGLINYSKWMVNRMHEHIPTSHVLTVQHDGWVLNPDSWKPVFMEYDYIGPLFLQIPHVGSGGFSFRSKKLMQLVAELTPALLDRRKGMAWEGYSHEDGMISYMLRRELEERGCRFPSPEIAAQFAYGGNAAHYCGKPFGFHGFYALDTLLGGKGEPIHRDVNFNLIPYKP